MITIKHTRAEGTLVYGSARGDGVWEVLKGLRTNWRPFRSIGHIGLTNSRDRAAHTWKIEEAAKALRAAGFEVSVQIDDATPGRSTAEIEAERAERAEDRTERFTGYSSSAAGRSDTAYSAYRQMADNWPTGQPLISDQARRSHKRMIGAHERASREARKAGHWRDRAEAAEANQSHHESIPATLRRIEKLEADERRIQRGLDGVPGQRDRAFADEFEPAAGEHRARLEAEVAGVRDQIAYWREHVAKAEESGVKVWARADFTKGDFVKSGGHWYEVERVNAKSLTVPSGTNIHLLPVVTRAKVRHAMGPSQWTNKVPYSEVEGRKSAADMAEILAEAERRESA